MDITDPRATHLRDGPTWVLSRWLFLRLLGVIYFIAFVSLAGQITGLVGEHGILPARAFLERAHALYGGDAYRLFPTLCWLGAGDGMLRALCWGGAVLALLVVAGVAQAPLLALLWLCYLSVSVAGQTIIWFQWDALLLETDLLRAHPARPEPAAGARALRRDALARMVAAVPAHVPLRDHEARERRPGVAQPHRARLPLLDPAPAAVDGVVRALAPGVDPSGDAAHRLRDRTGRPLAHPRPGAALPGAAAARRRRTARGRAARHRAHG